MSNKLDPRWQELAGPLSQSDPYQEASNAALRRILQHPYLPGAVRWAGVHSPHLYRQVIVDGPEAIHKSWTEQAPMDQFQRILDSWVDAHKHLCQLYSEETWLVQRHEKAR